MRSFKYEEENWILLSGLSGLSSFLHHACTSHLGEMNLVGDEFNHANYKVNFDYEYTLAYLQYLNGLLAANDARSNFFTENKFTNHLFNNSFLFLLNKYNDIHSHTQKVGYCSPYEKSFNTKSSKETLKYYLSGLHLLVSFYNGDITENNFKKYLYLHKRLAPLLEDELEINIESKNDLFEVMQARMYRTSLLTMYHPSDFYLYSHSYILKTINSGYLEEAKKDILFIIAHQGDVSINEPKSLLIAMYLSLIINDEKMCYSILNKIMVNKHFEKDDLEKLYRLVKCSRFKFT